MINQEFINEVTAKMAKVLDNNGLDYLKDVLLLSLHNKEILECKNELSVLTTEEINSELLKKFYLDCETGQLAQSTIKQYIRQSRKFLEYTNKSALDVTTEDIQIYLLMLKNRGCSDRTRNNTIHFIRTLYGFLKLHKYMNDNPFDLISAIKFKETKKTIVSEQDIEIMRDSCNDARDLAIIDFLYDTGVRVGELCNLTMNDIDFNNETVTVETEKTHKFRTIPLGAKAIKHLVDYRNYLAENNIVRNHLFLSSRKYKGKYRPISQSQCERLLKRYYKGKDKITVHTLRRTFATRCEKHGVPTTYISYLMGHESYNTTVKHYLKINVEDVLTTFRKKCC